MKEKFQKLIDEIKKIGRGIKNLRSFKFGSKDSRGRAGAIANGQLWRSFLKIFSNKEKIIALVLTIILVVDLITIIGKFYFDHTTAVADFGAQYTEGEIGAPQFINPLLAQSQTDKDLTTLVYAGLYKIDSRGHLVSDLAASPNPDVSADGKTYTIKIKPNLKWIDGQPLNADDVIFTIQTLQNPDFKSPLQKIWHNISIQKIDDLTVQFKNQVVSAPFLTNLTLGILPKHIWQNVSANQFFLTKLNLQPIGDGPYFVKEIRNAHDGSVQSITFESYSNYGAGKPYIDHVQINFYQNYQDALLALHSKEIQGLGLVAFNQKVFVDPKTTFKISKLPVAEYQALFFNLAKNHAILGDPAVRAALEQSLDRNKIITDVYDNLAFPDYGPILPGQIGYNPDIAKINAFNLDGAKKTLDQAGWVVDPKTGMRAKGGQVLQFSITTNDFVLNQNAADALKSQWQQIGANITVNIVPTADLESKYIRPRNFDSLLFAINAGVDPDPFVFWHSSQAKDPGLNIAQYKNTVADALIANGHNTFDPAKRTADYQQFQTVLATDVPAIFIAQSAYVYEIIPAVKGLELQVLANPENRFYDIVHWYIQTKRIFK